ncbi:hypothetical protein [Flavisolibacter ginsengisoli]|jgi:hypothetical protein|uniref:Uncharacterized protein n=1 Tax=Flavisolibacter ginsengisoli DSM 18119 TaxID=1121884 RepID=A0A1M5GNX2_9BACT|nr:hypothetical protein [Flavisolibacter ginsengisoli]SHG05393.1 hypothetical protein SAMN02745131_04194 [Flavisolibacter ginsengisoli DSM 18119]
MTTIRITEFKGYTKEMVYQYLQQSWPCFYKIVLPKSSDLQQGRDEISNDLLMADHLCNRLREQSGEILFSLPDPAKPGSFDFVLMTENLESLAETIALYANGYEGELPSMELFDEVVLSIGYRDFDPEDIPHYLVASENICLPDRVVDMSLYFE